jgi:predicted amidohydrolase
VPRIITTRSLLMSISLLVPGARPAAGEEAREPASAPDGWKSYAPREEIAPRFWVAPPAAAGGGQGYRLGLAGRGDDSVDGRWLRRVQVTSGKHYGFSAEYQIRNVAHPERSVLARLVWFTSGGKQVGPAEYPAAPRENPKSEAGWKVLSGVYQAPPEAAEGQLELHLRWAPRGEVLWRAAELKETAPPPPRRVRLAAVNYRPRGSKSSRENLEAFAKLIEEAASRQADLVCLPEGITICGTPLSYAQAAEPVPGPTTEFLGEAAKKSRLELVAGIYERDGKAIYNTSVLLGRDGGLKGKYRKVCLPREEIDGGITPGGDYPIFDAGWGRLGMMVCWDVHFPEVSRELARQGAEVICMPIWGGNEVLAQARAIENQIYVVASGYDFPTSIFDKRGKKIAQASRDREVILAEVDLNERVYWPFLGDWRSRIWREGPAMAASAADR